MKQSLSSRAPRPLVALLTFAALALGACSERPDATQPVPQTPNRIIICDEGCGGGGGSPPPPPPAPTITSLSLNNTTLAIEGVSVTYTATLANNGPTLSGVVAQGYIVQGSTRRAAGGTLVNCNAGMGVLPSGTCQISFSVVAGDSLQGHGTLVQGAATFELDLTTNSLLATRTAGVNLIPGDVYVSTPTMLSLSGAYGGVLVSIQGGSQTVSGLSYQMVVVQGPAHRAAGAMPMSCPNAALGTLPPGTAGCAKWISLSVTNTTSGAGMLVPGPATFQLSMLQNGTVVSTRNIPMMIIDGRITSVTPSPNPSRIGGGPQPFTMAVVNNGASLPGTAMYGHIRQGAALHGWVTAWVNCGGQDVLPAGSCVISGTYRADTLFTQGPYLVPGPATLYFVLVTDGGHATIDSTSVPITLVGVPTIGAVTPNGSPNISVFGTVAGYTAAINNPGPAISNATVMVKIIQGTASRQAVSGPVSVNCGSGAGTLPAGTCTFNGLYSASNVAPGTGVLVPGAATLQIQLSDPANGTVSTKLVPITILGS